MTLKIVSPVKGQHIPTGTNLTVTGISSDNSITNCQVSLLLNDLKPYQKTTPTGKSSSTDYSSWRYVINNSKYGSIKEGTNKITSKLTCDNSNQPNVASTGVSKWYSINITGISAKTVQSKPTIISKLPVSHNLNRSDTGLLHTNSSKPSHLQSTTSIYKPIEPTSIATKTNTNVHAYGLLR